VKFEKCEIDGLLVITPDVFEDKRGFFMETWNIRKFREFGVADTFVQQNHAGSKLGVIRGLHYQLKYPQGKLVRTLRGKVFDVAVDIRKSSPTFGKWHGQILSAENKRMMWIPQGFAHGYLALSERAEIQYSCTELYCPGDDHSISWQDPEIGIEWPLLKGIDPVLSAKDSVAISLADAEVFI
jgi:dTDP-4-dehydrorhamnose 3,5-epimerase